MVVILSLPSLIAVIAPVNYTNIYSNWYANFYIIGFTYANNAIVRDVAVICQRVQARAWSSLISSSKAWRHEDVLAVDCSMFKV